MTHPHKQTKSFKAMANFMAVIEAPTVTSQCPSILFLSGLPRKPAEGSKQWIMYTF